MGAFVRDYERVMGQDERMALRIAQDAHADQVRTDGSFGLLAGMLLDLHSR